ncbi:hypothetical protein GCM10010401_09320 [Rarobacter faecitabidus]|uniref:Alpha/beta hydrolase n=1 Tax=Rarobacter faecitabidus TaxID=13243 RepID=A0A542ZAC2_RARFA|nr:hypothetical protein [Rarobacter faecitabidus]TQL57241.1 hypothetical protein FB461_2364 [Rarobacter faecitabidus]
MHVLLIGGKHPRHKEWIRDLARAFEEAGDDPVIHDYANWDRGDSGTDVLGELAAVADLAETIEGPYAIVAKSIGTAITTIGVARGELRPTRVVFLGIPLSGLDEFSVAVARDLAALPDGVVVQNENDPWGTASEIEEFLAANGASQLRLVTIAGETTHDYLDFEQIVELTHEG